MSPAAPLRLNSFPALVQEFFSHYLPLERNLARNTLLSYRDALKLYIRFLVNAGRSAETLTCVDVLDPEQVRAFLRWLADERQCKASTRNQRLAALKSFTRFVASRAPEHLERCRAIRELPRARTEEKEIEYLDCDEMIDVIQGPDPDGPAGLRDRALLLLLYNTGARVQEICDLDIGMVRLDEAPCARLLGKGRKERICPLWGRTVTALHAWLETRRTSSQDAPLFLNAKGRRLTRAGVTYILKRAASDSGLRQFKHVRQLPTPHVIRHSTAMHLLQVGADLTVIASWLGHSQITTTHAYVTVNRRMKQEALAAASVLPELREGVFPPPNVITWLEQLGGRARYVDSSPPRPQSGQAQPRGST